MTAHPKLQPLRPTGQSDLIETALLIPVALSALLPIWIGTHMADLGDDAYITLSYARSLAQGYGFRIHPEAPLTLGTSSPLFALILAALSRVITGVSLEVLAVGVSILIWILTAWLWVWLGRSVGLSIAQRYTIGLFVMMTPLTWVFHLGMETRLFCFLLTLAILCFAKRWFVLAGLSAGLCTLARGEGILLLVVLPVFGLAVFKRAQWRFLAAAVIVLFAWVLYAQIAIGAILPTTLDAKIIQGRVTDLDHFAPFMFKVLTRIWGELGVIALPGGGSMGVYALLGVVGLLLACRVRKTRPMLVFAAWAVLYCLGYMVLGVPAYTWYALPILYVLVLLAGVFIGAIAEIPRIGSIASAIGAALIVFTLISTWVNIPPTIRDTSTGGYQVIAEWFNARYQPGKRILYIEIGALGYFGRDEVIDLLGLTNPEVLPDLARGDYAAIVMQTQPDYILYNATFDWAYQPILKSAYFQANYMLVETLPNVTKFMNNTPFYVYSKR